MVLCITNCGETFGALHHVDNYNIYGFRLGLLEDFSTSPVINAHPYLYTHNVNIGSIIYVLLESVGITSINAKIYFTIFISLIGLIYIYLIDISSILIYSELL